MTENDELTAVCGLVVREWLDVDVSISTIKRSESNSNEIFVN